MRRDWLPLSLPLTSWLSTRQAHGCGLAHALLPTQESCQVIKAYMDSTLGPFIVNVTSAALLCSQALCSSHGRCVRHPRHPEVLLTLNPAHFSIKPTHNGRPPILKGTLSFKDWVQMTMKFKCRCYRGWRGKWCHKQSMW